MSVLSSIKYSLDIKIFFRLFHYKNLIYYIIIKGSVCSFVRDICTVESMARGVLNNLHVEAVERVCVHLVSGFPKLETRKW